MKILSFAAVVTVILLSSCNDKSSIKSFSGLLKSGDYAFQFDLDTLTIPVQFRVDDNGHWSIYNWTEKIEFDTIAWQDSSFQVKMPLFSTSLKGRVLNDSTFAGIWTDHTREQPYEIPFVAKKAQLPALPKKVSSDKLVYSVLFSPEIPLSHDDAIGLFYRYDTLLYGTFLTRSGDHRFLQGRYNQEAGEIMLTGFDGAHLFHYRAEVKGDSLIGKFYSGKHHSANWIGVKNPQAKLQHPDSLVQVKDPKAEFTLKVRAENGDSVLFNKDNLSGKVSIVQVSGSWCANCIDETRFLQQLYEKYSTKGLQVIPVQFERTDDFDLAVAQVSKQHNELELTYPAYFGGKLGSGAIGRVFHGITRITAYPTAIFIDKKGEIRKIHTGFYGPGTGDFHRIYTTELESFVQMLLNE